MGTITHTYISPYLKSLNCRAYEKKLAELQKELQQLQNGTHIDYIKQLGTLEFQQESQ